jgi:hypothetical protein
VLWVIATPRREAAQTRAIYGIGHGELLSQHAVASGRPGVTARSAALSKCACFGIHVKWTNMMAKREEDSPAKLAIIEEWDAWARKNPDNAKRYNGMLFFLYLQEKRPDLLLDFKYLGDKWQIIHKWLLGERRVDH